jgi:hypothetical protein
MDWNTRLTKPMAAITGRKDGRSGMTAAAACRRPKVAAIATSTRCRGRGPVAASSAPAHDPIARMMLNRPYMLAVPPNADFAIAVSTMGKFRPKVPSVPTRKIVHSRSGRPRTYRAASRTDPAPRADREDALEATAVRSDGRKSRRPTVGPM